MRCPKCEFITFDHVEACPKCKASLSKLSSDIQGTTLNVQPPSFLGAFAHKSQEASVDDLLDAPDLVLPSGGQAGQGDSALSDQLEAGALGDELSAEDLLFDEQPAQAYGRANAGGASEDLPELELSFGDDVEDTGAEDPSLQKLSSNLSDIDLSDLMPESTFAAGSDDDLDDDIPTLEPMSFDQGGLSREANASTASLDLGDELFGQGGAGSDLDDIDLDSISFSDLDSSSDLGAGAEEEYTSTLDDGLDDLSAVDFGDANLDADALADDDGLDDFGDLLASSGGEDDFGITGDQETSADLPSLGAGTDSPFDLTFDEELPSLSGSGGESQLPDLSLEVESSGGPLGAGGKTAPSARPDIPDLGLTLESDD